MSCECSPWAQLCAVALGQGFFVASWKRVFVDEYLPAFSDKPSPMTEFPMRQWSLKLFLLDEEGNERPADVFTKVVYNLHPTFENPVQSKLWSLPQGQF